MLIGIEASRANKFTKTGVEWYAWHLIQELKKLTRGDGHSWSLYTNDILQGGLEHLPPHWYETRIGWPLPYGWTQFRLSWELWRRPVDVMFFPGSTLSRYSPKRTVVTVHDVGFRRFPQVYKQRQIRIHDIAMREIKNRAARVITVSNFSAHEIAEVYGIPLGRISVVPNGIDHALYRPMSDRAAIEACRQRYRIPEHFFLTIGRLEAKKNILNLIKAFDAFKQTRGADDPHALVLVGVPGFGYGEIRQAIQRSSARASIFLLGYAPETDLPLLLNAATALIHPSWYEGFGIPPILAMACGTPVLSSNAASLPEVVGPEAGLLFPPDQPEALTSAMIQVVESGGVREKLRAAGLARAGDFTWKHTAQMTHPILASW